MKNTCTVHNNGEARSFKAIYIYSSTRNVNLLKTKRNLLYIRNQSVPRCKHFPPRLEKPNVSALYKESVRTAL